MTPRERAVLAVDTSFGYTLEFAPGCDQHFQTRLYDMVEEAIIAARREAIEECARIADRRGDVGDEIRAMLTPKLKEPKR